MGGIISAITGVLGGGVKDLVLGVLDRIKIPPEEKAKIELAMAQNAFELQKLETEYQAKLLEAQSKEVEIASANIRAEATNGDKYTSRARPTFMYLCCLILGWNYIIVPLFHHPPLDFPEPMVWLFGSAILGYTGARSWEKIGMPKSK
jgi:hypothetical protein